MKNRNNIVIGIICLIGAITIWKNVNPYNYARDLYYAILQKIDNEGTKPEGTVAQEPEDEVPRDINMDIISRYYFPSLERMSEQDQNVYVNSLQVMQRVKRLKLESQDFLYPELHLAAAQQRLMSSEQAEEKQQIDFYGTAGGELQDVINQNQGKTILIHSEALHLEDTIQLKSNTHIVGQGVRIMSDKELDYAFYSEGCSEIRLDSIEVKGDILYGIYCVDVTSVTITDCTIIDLKEKPLVLIGECTNFIIKGNTFENNHAGGIYIAGDAAYGMIAENKISGNQGTSQWMSGITLTGVVPKDGNDIWEAFDEERQLPYKEKKLYMQLESPHEIIVRENKIAGHQASGIYLDGAYNCYLVKNNIENNGKVGIYLDYGTLGCYLKENNIDGNGSEETQAGIVLDNAAYNIIQNNTVLNHTGDGINLMRASVRNLIFENIIKDNNRSKDEQNYYYGIALNVENENNWYDVDVSPEYENIICRNVINGGHYAGVYLAEECSTNDFFNNVILDPIMYSIESDSTKYNSVINNTSDKGMKQ